MKKIALAAEQQLDNIISFWKCMQDHEYGGYCGYVGYDLIPQWKADKGCILHTRILWFFSEAALLLGREDLRQQAEYAYRFLTEHFLDKKNGGVFWSVAYNGQQADTTKHTYNQAFTIYGLSAYYRLTGNSESIRLAKELFYLTENRCTDEIGYLEAFSRDWKLEPNEKLSENGVIADKTMNTLLHVFEGYSGLYLATKDAEVGQAMKRILTIYRQKIFDPAARCQKVFFDKNYDSILDLRSYGHDIESSWLIEWGCALLEDPSLSREIDTISSMMAEEIYQKAYRNHSILNECVQGVTDKTRVWWVQAEAVLGFLHHWEKHPQETIFRDAASDVFNYICQNIVDRRAGSEWFWCVDADNRPIPHKPIVEPWKCPYHNGRMCIELIRKDPDIYV